MSIAEQNKIIASDFEQIILARSRFNGKAYAHWQAQADELVIELIVRAATQTDSRSLIGYLANKRLIEIAKMENPTLFAKVLKIQAICYTGFARIIKQILS